MHLGFGPRAGPSTRSSPITYIDALRLVLVADHPGPRRGKTLGAAFRLRHQPCPLLGRAAAAARAMRDLVFGQRLWRVAALLVGSERLAAVGRHAEEVRR